ncbi:MAG: helix-turn-helix domain-containing protein [Alphaproteobacteria bacterium]|nr:helix-turn-helix domain-containing protein [Alphaproteobacteria bacterium]
MEKIEGRQIRGARGLLGWSAEHLAERTGLTRQAIKRIEDGAVRPREGTLADIMRVLDEQGIEFSGNSGVRFKPQGVEVLTGDEGLRRHFDNVYEYMSKHGGLVQHVGMNEMQLYNHIRYEFSRVHVGRMMDIAAERDDVNVRAILCEGDAFFGSDYTEYRWQARGSYDDVAYYLYGDRLAIMSFVGEPSPIVVTHKIPSIAQSYRRQFEALWKDAVVPPGYKFRRPRPGDENKGAAPVWQTAGDKRKR